MKVSKDYLEVLMYRQIEDEGLITPHKQFKFHRGRRWAFDFAWPGIMTTGFFHSLALEIDGGIWLKRGGHTSGVGFEGDREKDAAAASHGWIVLRVTSKMVKSGEAIRHLKMMLLRASPLDIGEGVCHALKTETVPTATSRSKAGGAKPSTTRSVRKGKGPGSRRLTATRPRRPRRPRPHREVPRRLPKEIVAYDKAYAKETGVKASAAR